VLCICNTVDVIFVHGEYFYFAFHFILFFSHSVKLTSGFQISTNYDKIILKLAALSIALARLDTIFPAVREITRIKTDNFRIKSGICKTSIGSFRILLTNDYDIYIFTNTT
jgi:hypothetical protein